jgi:hypothetical protein
LLDHAHCLSLPITTLFFLWHEIGKKTGRDDRACAAGLRIFLGRQLWSRGHLARQSSGLRVFRTRERVRPAGAIVGPALMTVCEGIQQCEGIF